MVVTPKENHWKATGITNIGLEKGKHYIVYSIDVWLGGVSFSVLDYPEATYPVSYESDIFTIVDASLPDDWKVGPSIDGDRRPCIAISFPEMVDDPKFYGRLFDSAPNDKEREIFNRYRVKYEELYKGYL